MWPGDRVALACFWGPAGGGRGPRWGEGRPGPPAVVMCVLLRAWCSGHVATLAPTRVHAQGSPRSGRDTLLPSRRGTVTEPQRLLGVCSRASG